MSFCSFLKQSAYGSITWRTFSHLFIYFFTLSERLWGFVGRNTFLWFTSIIERYLEVCVETSHGLLFFCTPLQYLVGISAHSAFE